MRGKEEEEITRRQVVDPFLGFGLIRRSGWGFPSLTAEISEKFALFF